MSCCLTELVLSVGSSVSLPYSRYGITVSTILSLTMIKAKLGLVVMWNQKDSLWVC